MTDYYAYPETEHLSLRDRKTLLLQQQQRMLKTGSTEDMLRFQQRVLRENLLAPQSMKREEKIGKIKYAQQVLKDLERVERERLKKEKQLKEKLKKAEEKIQGRIIKEEDKRRIPFY